MIRVLHIANARMQLGGVETFLMNVYRRIDRTRVQFDFIVFSKQPGEYDEEIRELGGKIYVVTQKSESIIKNFMEIYCIVKKNHYFYVHRHCGASIMWLDLLASYMGGAKIRIAHAHSTSWEHKAIHWFGRGVLRVIATDYLACGELAGVWMYGKKEFQVVHNGIDIEKFLFNQKERIKMRKQYFLEDKFVIGNIALFKPGKNLCFLLDIFYELCKLNEDVHLIIIGDGEEREELERKINQLGLKNRVMLPGCIMGVENWLQMFDLYVSPSLFEGVPVSLIEAQVSGLPCIVSDSISSEVDITGLIKSVPLEMPALCWAEKILEVFNSSNRCSQKAAAERKGYSIEETVTILQEFYLNKKVEPCRN